LLPTIVVSGHVAGVGETRGLAFFENGEIATSSGKLTIDYTNGSGPHMAYHLHTFSGCHLGTPNFSWRGLFLCSWGERLH